MLRSALVIALLAAVANVAWSQDTYVGVLTWGRPGAGNGEFALPFGIAFDAQGNIYVADANNHRVQKFDASGDYQTQWGSHGTGPGQFQYSNGIAVNSSGIVYVADLWNHRVQMFTTNGVYIGHFGSYGTGNGQFANPNNLALDGAGNVYVVDGNNHRVQKFTSAGAYVTKWGGLGTSNGRFQYPRGIAVDAAGFVYVVDMVNYRVQKFTSTGSYVLKWGTAGVGDGQFMLPMGVAVDGSGNVFVVDHDNERVQRFSTSGAYLGQFGSYGSTLNQFESPLGIAVNASGDVFVGDGGQNERVTKFTPGRLVSGNVVGGIWSRPNDAAPWPLSIPGVQVQGWRGTTAITAPAWTDLGGNYDLGFPGAETTDVVTVTARNAWLEVRDYAGTPDPPPHITQPIGSATWLPFIWPSTQSYAGDALNAYFIAEEFGRVFWDQHMGRAIPEYKIRVNRDTKDVIDMGGASTGVSGTAPLSSFKSGMAQHQDVVCHELVHGAFFSMFGHALSQASPSDLPDESSEAKGLDEGLADYFTFAFTGRPGFGFNTNAYRPLDAPDPAKIPWCFGYRDRQKGYRSAPAISGAIYDLRQAIGVGQPGAPTAESFDRWLLAAVTSLAMLPLEQRTPVELRSLLAAVALEGANYGADVAAAFDRHNIKSSHDNTACGPIPEILSAERSIVGDVLRMSIGWGAVPGAATYRIYLGYRGSVPGLGPGTIVGEGTETAFAYEDPDTTAAVTLTVVPVDSAGHEGNASDPVPSQPVGVGGPTRVGRQVLYAWPNPARDVLSVQAAWRAGERARLVLLDVSGRRVGATELGRGDGAAAMIRWDLRAVAERPLSPGLYFLWLETPRARSTTKITLLP